MNTGSSYNFLFEVGLKEPNYAISPVYSNKTELLNSIIHKIIVFVSAPEKELGAKIQRFTSCSMWLLPARISPCNFNHVSIIVETTDGEYILIEYGVYNKYREGEYHGKVHYFEGNDGLRFTQMTQKDIDKANENQFNFFVFCNVKNHMTINEMLYKTKFQGSYHQWDGNNYNLFTQNCQLFVRKVIQVLGATRANEKQKSRTVMKCCLPFRVLNALEDNENDLENVFEMVPVVGQVYGLFKVILG